MSDGSIILWDVASNAEIKTIGDREIGHLNYISGLDWSLDGAQIVTASRDTTAILWDVEAGEPIHHYELSDDSVGVNGGTEKPQKAKLEILSHLQTIRVEGNHMESGISPRIGRQCLVARVDQRAVERRLKTHELLQEIRALPDLKQIVPVFTTAPTAAAKHRQADEEWNDKPV